MFEKRLSEVKLKKCLSKKNFVPYDMIKKCLIPTIKKFIEVPLVSCNIIVV